MANKNSFYVKHLLGCFSLYLLSVCNISIAANAPHFVLPDLQNRLQTAKQWNGKLRVINFWATWCAPCKEEIPLFNRYQEKYQNDDVVFVGIAIDNKTAVRKFNRLIPINYANLIGGEKAFTLTTQFGNKQGILPYTVIVNKQNEMVTFIRGKLTEGKLTALIEKNL